MDFPYYFTEQKIPKNYLWNAKTFFVPKHKMQTFPTEQREAVEWCGIYGEVSKYHPVDNKHPLNPVVNVKANYTVSFVFITTDLVRVSINSTLGSPLFLIKNVFLIQPYTYKWAKPNSTLTPYLFCRHFSNLVLLCPSLSFISNTH